MAPSLTPNGVSLILTHPSPDPLSDSSITLQVQHLQRKQPSGRYIARITDGTQTILASLQQELCKEAESGHLVENCLLQVSDYVINRHRDSVVVMILRGEVIAAGSRSGEDADVKPAEVVEPFSIKSKGVDVASDTCDQVLMSAAQIVNEQRGTAAPAKQMGVSRRVYPIVSLNPYQGNWTIKVRVTSKGPLRTFRNSRGEGKLFNVELTDEDGTQIQATMFKDAADKFFNILQLNKVYYISKGSLRMANKHYATVENDYEMTLNASSEIVEAPEDCATTKLPSMNYNFVQMGELGQHVTSKKLIDVIGVVQSVGSLTTIRRKSNNDEIPKRDIIIADQSQKTVVVTLWNDIAANEGTALAETVGHAPILLARALRLSDFQGVSLSTTINSMVVINPVIPAAGVLRTWYDQKGKTSSMTPAGASLSGGVNQIMPRSSFADRAVLSEITKPSAGEGKPAYYNVRACISYIKPDQAMWYLACAACNRKVIEDDSSRYWCEGCQKHSDSCSRRYIMQAKVSDSSGEAWVSAFNEQVELLLRQSADNLSEIRNQGGDGKDYETALRKAMWLPQVYRISVAQTEYMNEKRQRLTIRTVMPVDWVAESRQLLADIPK